MSEQDSPKPATKSALLKARASIASTLTSAQKLAEDGVGDETVVAALITAADALRWFGTFEYLDNGVNVPVALVDALPGEIQRRYLSATQDAEGALFFLTEEDSQATAAEATELALRSVAELLRRAAERLPKTWAELISLVEAQYVTVQSTLNSLRLWLRTRGAVEKIEEAADSQAESAGQAAEHNLSTEFDALAADEARQADYFRRVTFLLFVVVIGWSSYVAHREDDFTSATTQKLLVGIPILLLALVVGREASQHRRTARWAGILGAQLRSVRAYTVSMPPDHANELRLELGRRALLQSPNPEPVPSNDGADSGGSIDPNLIREITDLIRSVQKPS